jgi:hypothetical protein
MFTGTHLIGKRPVFLILGFCLRLENTDIPSPFFHLQTRQRRPIGRLCFNLSSWQPAPETSVNWGVFECISKS